MIYCPDSHSHTTVQVRGSERRGDFHACVEGEGAGIDVPQQRNPSLLPLCSGFSALPVILSCTVTVPQMDQPI